MRKFVDSLREHLKDPEFKKEWDALEPEFRLIRQQLESEQQKSFSSSVEEQVEFEAFSVAQ